MGCVYNSDEVVWKSECGSRSVEFIQILGVEYNSDF